MKGVLVTGGGRRIGRAIVERLAADGWAVAVHYNGSADGAEAAADAVRSQGGKAATVRADLADSGAVRALMKDAASALGSVTALVNNASVFIDDSDDIAGEVWDAHMAVHVRAPFILSRALADALADGENGAIVNMVDQRVLNPTKHFPSYTLSKMALWDQTQVLARALAPSVRVNAVGPGPVLPSERQSEDDFLRQAAQTPLARVVDPADVAAAVAYFLDAPSVTGQMIAVDSGQHLNWAFETDETAPKE